MAQSTAIETSIPDPVDPPVPDTELPAEPIEGDDAAIEARAREMGWKPLAEYRGPPGKWQPAADFVARGENILPIMRQQNRALTEKVGRFEGEITSMRRTLEEQSRIIKDLRDMGRKADQRGYDRAMAEIKAQQRQAVERGDTATYDQLVEQAEALASERPAAPVPATTTEAPKPPDPPPRPALSPAVQAFVAQNAWFNADAFLTRKMIDRHIDVIQEGDIADETAQLAEAKRRLVEDYPERFGAPAPMPALPAAGRAARRRTAAVASPTPEPPAPPTGAATTINSIADPAERASARDAFNRMKRQMPDYTEAEYMAVYADPHNDVLSLHQQQRTKERANAR